MIKIQLIKDLNSGSYSHRWWIVRNVNNNCDIAVGGIFGEGE